MSKAEFAKVKLSFWETIRQAWGPYRRLYGYAGPYKWRFALGLGFGVSYSLVTSLLPIAVYRVSSFVFPGGAPNPRTAILHHEAFNVGPNIDSIVWICLAIPIIMTVRSLCSYGGAYYMAWVSNRVVNDIRNQLFTKVIGHSMDFFNRMKSGYLMSRIQNDARNLQQALASVSSDVFKQPTTIIGAVIVLLLMDWKFTVVSLILFPSCLLPIRYFGKRARQAVQREQKGGVLMSVTMHESFSGIRVIKSFAREEQQEKLFRRGAQQSFSQTMRQVKAMEAVGPLIEIIASIGIALALWYVYAAHLGTGRFLGLITGIFIIYDPIKTLSKLHIVMQRSLGATTAIFAILDSKPTVQDAPNAVELVSSQGRIDFENVTFRYSTGVADAVQNINLHIEPGKTYALVGASGAGKSTILSLILRLYDPTTGSVKIDGNDLRSLTQKSLREQVGLVSQETFLFHDTIFKNIQFGRLNASAEEVYAAAQTASAHEFILAQPNGYETVIGDKGCLLSGGQQQRLAIARALLKNAPILLLDEATSSLDTESEKQIQKALERLSEGRTVIAIAHRLSTILSADQIVVLEDGNIKEVGTHAELLEKSGYYRRLYDLQFNQPTEIVSETASEPDVLAEELV
ncbi:MAG: ATP-binding cassette domain-containing protein [Verrucomicrobia bacterium]|nr:ATP-binding cassette domain-containing protein [Verrucomicrobiota bacterium]